jgi:siroheme synthase
LWINHALHERAGIAIVSKGTTPEQQILKGTLETIPGMVARTQIQSPTLIIVGEVVNFPEDAR